MSWANCRYLTASVLPVRSACDLACKFCFSRSSLSALPREVVLLDLERYYAYARERGATRLVVTGGGEPLLRPEETLRIIGLGRRWFEEIACFTNGTLLTPELARALQREGMSYLCWSRHHWDDAQNSELMGGPAPTLDDFLGVAQGLTIRASCVMAKGYIDTRDAAGDFMEHLGRGGVREYTFKHTYVAYPDSVFRGSAQDSWAAANQVERDIFANEGEVLARLPWGPAIRRIGPNKVAWYREPTPTWELAHGLGRSLNLLADGAVYGSLEDAKSLLFQAKAQEPV